MLQLDDEELLKLLKNNESEVYTLAEIHKALLLNNFKCSVNEIRKRVHTLFCDGYLGIEPSEDDVSMYFLIFCPEY